MNLLFRWKLFICIFGIMNAPDGKMIFTMGWPYISYIQIWVCVDANSIAQSDSLAVNKLVGYYHKKSRYPII